MINSGAILTAALIKSNLSAADKFDFVSKIRGKIAFKHVFAFSSQVWNGRLISLS